VPGSVLVRGALDGQLDAAVVRAAVAACSWIAEQARLTGASGRFWWEAALAVPAARMAAEMGLGPSEAEAGLRALEEARVLLRDPEDRFRVSPDVLCEHPVLASIGWAAVRAAVRRQGGRLGPAIAVLREIARLGPADRADAGVVLALTELVDATLYGKSAVSQALADLEASALIRRLPSPGRRALHLGLTPAVVGQSAPAETSAAPAESTPRTGFTVPQGVPIRLGGAASMPAPEGLVVEVGAGVRIRVERDDDGQEVCRIGPLVIGRL
jgi:hypothetical protein